MRRSKVAFWPACTTPTTLFVIARSGVPEPSRERVTVLVSLSGLMSPAVDTRAVLTTVGAAAAATATVTTTSTDWPGRSGALRVQVTSAPLAPHVKEVPVR